MATVAVTIAGRSYRMACGEGEEAHLRELARHVDLTLSSLRKGFGEIGDTRLVIMTAITVADELHEAKRRIFDLEEELAKLTATRSDADASDAAFADEVAASINAVSERIECLVQDLNGAEKL